MKSQQGADDNHLSGGSFGGLKYDFAFKKKVKESKIIFFILYKFNESFVLFFDFCP